MNEITSPGRRWFLKLSGSIAAGVVVSATFVHHAAAALPHLNPATNATAKALHYTDNANESAMRHSSMQYCMMCQHYKGHMGEVWGPCGVFPGYEVNAMGWCGAYQARNSMMHMLHGKG